MRPAELKVTFQMTEVTELSNFALRARAMAQEGPPVNPQNRRPPVTEVTELLIYPLHVRASERTPTEHQTKHRSPTSPPPKGPTP